MATLFVSKPLGRYEYVLLAGNCFLDPISELLASGLLFFFVYCGIIRAGRFWVEYGKAKVVRLLDPSVRENPYPMVVRRIRLTELWMTMIVTFALNQRQGIPEEILEPNGNRKP